MFRSLFRHNGKPFSFRRGAGALLQAAQPRPPLTLDPLEDRIVPTIVFDPVLGAESLKTDGGYRLNSPPAFLIFWGSYWQSDPGQQESAAIVAAAQKLVAGPYFSGLKEYNTDGKVTWGNFDFFTNDPPQNFSHNDLYAVVKDMVDNENSHIPRPTTPDHLPLYMVFTPPGITSDQPTANGYHTAESRVRFAIDGIERDLFYFGWVSTNHTLDDATTILSHEMAETITDPTVGGLGSDFPFGSVADGIHFNHPGSAGDDEVGDAEAQNYRYRVNDVLVQSYWSNRWANFRIADGNQQNFEVETLPDNSRRLLVRGDQLPNRDDTISVNAVDPIYVRLNNELATFETSQNIHSVLVVSGDGTDTIETDFILSATLDINSSGNATVNLQYGALESRVTITSPFSHTKLHVLAPLFTDDPLIVDSFDNGAYGRIRGGGRPAPIEYLYAGTDSLTIEGKQVYILATGAPTQFISEGTAANRATISVGNTGNIQDIKGALTINGGQDGIDLIVDDSFDAVARTLSMDNVSLGGADYGRIAFSGGVAAINYKYDSTHTLTVITGTGSTIINVAATGTTTKITAYAGDAKVIVSNSDGMVQGIVFPLTVTNPVHSTMLTVNDFNDPVSRTVTLDTVALDSQRYGRITISGSAPVYYQEGDAAGVSVRTGRGGAEVAVLATIATTTLAAQASGTTVKVGNAGHLQLNLEADLFITGPVVVDVDASADPGNLGAFLDRVERADGAYGRIYNLARGMIYYRYADTRSLLLQSGMGTGPNPALLIVDATGVPTTLTGHGDTVVNVGRGSVGQINGELTINNVAGRTTITVDNRNDTTKREDYFKTVDLSGAPHGRISFLYGSADINYKYSDTQSVTVHTGMGGDVVYLLATGAPTTVIGHAPVTKVSVGVGSQVQGIAAPLTLASAEGSMAITVDDSSDSQQRQTTYDTVLIGSTPYGRISGLAPAEIRYQYAGTDNVTIVAGYFGGTTNVLATGAPLVLSNSFDATVNVGNNGSVQDIRGELRIGYATNYGALNIDDSADNDPRTATYGYSNGFDRIVGLAPAPIFHRAQQSVTVRLGSGGGTFNLSAATITSKLYLITNGNTTVNVGTGMGLSLFTRVDVTAAAGVTRLLVDDSADGGNSLLLDATDFRATLTAGGGFLAFTGNPDSDMTVNLGPRTNVSINNTTPFKTTINTGGGGNVYVNKISPGTQVIMNGGAGFNQLFGPGGPDTWHITGPNSGDLGNGVLQFSNYPIVFGGSGDDYFYFQDGASLTELHDPGGTNTLDYSNWSGDVFFLPGLFKATATGYIDGFQNAVGGKGTSILVGYGTEPSVLKGGTGRNLLIAGFGVPATLVGNADEDILIGGWTSYNTDLAALQAIMAEWARTDEDYDSRVANLQTGNGVPRLDKTTVYYNLGGNTLLGGPGRDFFFGRKATDQNDWDAITEVFVEL